MGGIAYCCNISRFRKSRTAGFASRLRLADYAGGLRCAFVVCRLCVYVDIVHDDHFRTYCAISDTENKDAVDSRAVDIADRNRTYRFFVFNAVLDAVPVHCAVWTGSGFGGFRAQQLCGKALFVFGDELSALLLWRRCYDKPVHHVACALSRTLERWLPLDSVHPVGDNADMSAVGAALEKEK